MNKRNIIIIGSICIAILIIVLLLLLCNRKPIKEKLINDNIMYTFGRTKYKPIIINNEYPYLPYIYGRELFTICYINNLYTYCDIIMEYNYMYHYGGSILTLNVTNPTDCIFFIDGNQMEIATITPKHIIVYKVLMLFEHIYRLEHDYALNILNNNEYLYNIYNNTNNTNTNTIIKIQDRKIIPQITTINEDIDLTWTKEVLPNEIKEYGWYNVSKYQNGKYILEIYKQEKLDLYTIDNNRRHIYKNFQSLLFNNDFYYLDHMNDNVEFNIHRIWLTNLDNPYEINEKNLENIINTYNIYDNSYYPWKIILWLNTNKLTKTIKYLRDKCPNIDIRIISENDLKFAKKIYDSFMKDNLYASASDILRLNVLYIYGGIYLDLGIIFTKDISNLYLESDRIFYYDKFGEIDISIQSCKYKMNDPMYLQFLSFLDSDGWRKYNYVPSLGQIIFTGREYIQLLLESQFYNSKVLLLYDNFCIRRKSLSSWYITWLKKKTDLWLL